MKSNIHERWTFITYNMLLSDAKDHGEVKDGYGEIMEMDAGDPITTRRTRIIAQNLRPEYFSVITALALPMGLDHCLPLCSIDLRSSWDKIQMASDTADVQRCVPSSLESHLL